MCFLRCVFFLLQDGAFPFFTRLGGTATGGAAFLGLVRLLTSAKTFADCLALAQKGDATKVNKLVSDIYGQDLRHSPTAPDHWG